jgi:hypothetical protein
MKRRLLTVLSIACSVTFLLCVSAPSWAQTISQGDSWWVWHGLAADGGVTVCPAGDGPSYLEIFVADDGAVGIEGAVVSLVLGDAGPCTLADCEVVDLLTDQFGYAVLYPRVGLGPPTTACCTIIASVEASFEEEPPVTILFDGTEAQDSRSWPYICRAGN